MAEPIQTNNDFGYDEYFQITLEILNANLAAGSITPEEYNNSLKALNRTKLTSQKLKQLPGYYEAIKVWASRLPLGLGSKWHISPSGRLVNGEGVYADPETEKQEKANYFKTGENQIDPMDWYNYVRNLTNDTAAYQKWVYEEQAKAAEAAENRRLAEIARAKSENETSYQRATDELNRHFAQIEADKDRTFQEKQLAMSGEQNAWIRANQQAQLQLERDKYGAQLESQPKSWIEAWKFRNAPAIQQQQNTAQDWIRTTSELPDLQRRAEEQRQYFYNTYPQAQGTPVSQYANSLSSTDPDFIMAARALQTWQNRLNQTQAMAGQSAPAMPATTPNAPEWLPAFVPGLQAGQPITQQRARVASGQQWQATPWSQRQMLGGYLEYASPKGIPTLTDYEQMVESMLPQRSEKTPRWIPQRQW